MTGVSVIIPTYNSSSFIVDAITSINNNDYKDIEIIIVDDGSTDSTVEIINSLSGNIKLFTQKNSGRGMARNNGVKHAEGKYIAFLDHDDLLETSSLSERVNYLEDHQDIGWVFTDAMEFDKSGELRLFLNQFPWLDLGNDHFCQLLKGCFPLTSTIMIRSELMRQVGGFNTAIDYGDDIELFLRLFLISKVGMIRKPLTRRRIHPTQGVSSTFDRWNSRVGIYSNFKPSIGKMTDQQHKALNDALKFAYYKLGECYWECNDFKIARSMFLNSYGDGSHSFKALLYAALCTAPNCFISMLRNIKKSSKD